MNLQFTIANRQFAAARTANETPIGNWQLAIGN
jgi:hypothetical protein